ncbi:unnamed protein product [Mytilus edulis]|uniref:Uncharacterized protein n=1 Tax=Mytilus edulis TaxID=6550 RepID=A0A8S3UTR8_MYTED|nr:unnamed protein product [Mytilus edulis]
MQKKEKLSPYAYGLPAEARTRYQEKLAYNKGLDRLPDPYAITKSEWVNDPSIWPELDFGQVYLYLIETPSMFNKSSMKAYKSLEAYRYVESGHVDQIKIYDVNGSPFCFLKADVIGSMKIRDKPHQPWVCLAKDTADIYCAHCTCLAGLGEMCSHIAAVLFKIELGVRYGVTQKSVTSEECKWNKVFRKQVDVSSIMDIQHLMNSNRKKKLECVIPSSKDPLPDKAVLESLSKVCPNAAFFSLIPPMNDEVTVETSVKVKHTKEEKLPRPLTSFYDVTNKELTLQELIDKSDQLFRNYHCSISQSANLFKITEAQNISPLWFEHRKGRITASKAHEVLTLRPTTNPNKLIMRISGYNSYDLSKKEAIKWGLEKEAITRDTYIQYMEKNHSNFECKLSGLKISEQNYFLGASADGVISCSCCGRGTLEIKCPHKHKDKSSMDAAKEDPTFCLDTQLHLKNNHKYYTQIQFQMFVYDTDYCDFVVMTSPNDVILLAIVRICRDPEFCNTLISKCTYFVKELLIPELLTRKLLHDYKVANTSVNDVTKEKYCLCEEPEYGKMIFCDGDSCDIGWYHYQCVNIVRKPRGKWLCPKCKK